MATDGSPVFGFGVSALNVGNSKVRALGHWSLRPNAIAVNDDQLTASELKARVGRPNHVAVSEGRLQNSSFTKKNIQRALWRFGSCRTCPRGALAPAVQGTFFLTLGGLG